MCTQGALGAEKSATGDDGDPPSWSPVSARLSPGKERAARGVQGKSDASRSCTEGAWLGGGRARYPPRRPNLLSSSSLGQAAHA